MISSGNLPRDREAVSGCIVRISSLSCINTQQRGEPGVNIRDPERKSVSPIHDFERASPCPPFKSSGWMSFRAVNGKTESPGARIGLRRRVDALALPPVGTAPHLIHRTELTFAFFLDRTRDCR